jgi:hypothetical protein
MCGRKFTAITKGPIDAIQKLQEGHIHFDGFYYYCEECLAKAFSASHSKDKKNYVGHLAFIDYPDDEDEETNSEEENSGEENSEDEDDPFNGGLQ